MPDKSKPCPFDNLHLDDIYNIYVRRTYHGEFHFLITEKEKEEQSLTSSGVPSQREGIYKSIDFWLDTE